MQKHETLREERITILVTLEEKQAIQREAKEHGQRYLTQYARLKLLANTGV